MYFSFYFKHGLLYDAVVSECSSVSRDSMIKCELRGRSVCEIICRVK